MIALLLLIALGAGAARASAAEAWHSQQPAGESGGFPLLGEVGDIECWNGEANRCLLISGGNAGVAAGIFAYDGSGWYRYSTVCGGHEGRIAWAGPTEFWTISDQQAGQATKENPATFFNVSLCHFKGGQLVGSYGEPIKLTNSYMHMFAAACAGSSDCWFAGERLPGTLNQGAFHLHWNGSTVSPIPSPTVSAELSDPGRAVTGLAFHEGGFYESVKVAEGDVPNLEEEEKEPSLGPSLLHRIEPQATKPFKPLFGTEPFSFGGAPVTEMQGFQLAGGDGEDLWAIAGAEGFFGSATVLRLGAEGLKQLPLEDPGGVLGHEVLVTGVAPEPGSEAAWVSFKRVSDPGESLSPPARLTRILGNGQVEAEVNLPLPGDEVAGEPVGNKGNAGPIACPGPEQCWLATRKGWLFHLGADPAKQSDPALHVLITSRPPDNSLPSIPPIELPEDDSGDSEGSSEQEPVGENPFEAPKVKPALLYDIKQRLIGSATLELSFSLRARARVQLIAKHGRATVAKTRKQVRPKGRHSLRLRLDPDRWPTDVDLDAKELKSKGSGK